MILMSNSVEKNAVIIGSSGAIGKALVEAVSASGDYQKIHALSRKTVKFEPYNVYSHSISLECEESISNCLLYTSPSPRDQRGSRMPSSA